MPAATTGFKAFVQRARERLALRRGGPALDALLAHANPDAPLVERINWAEDFFAWVRRDVPATRLKLFLQVLERQPETRARVAMTLRSLARDTQALDLFAETGLPRGAALTHELTQRLSARLLPGPPDSPHLDDIFDRLFPRAGDGDWLEHLEPDAAGRVMALFDGDDATAGADWSGMRADLEDALVQLADRICVVGSTQDVRRRLPDPTFRELPFQKLPLAVEALLGRRRAGVLPSELAAELNHTRAVTEACYRALEDVTGCLEKTGVNTMLVYDLARLHGQLRRLEMLLEIWATPERDVARTLALVADLARQNHAARSVRDLIRQNLHLLTRRIVERNAETGEHYVARNGREYFAMWRSAAGGGFIVSFTSALKLLLAKLALSEFFQGAAFGFNYAAGFVAIQLCGCTLATKQPASTAPALARRMEELRTAPQLEALVDEVVFLIRSQIAAIFGNIALVIPVTFLIDIAWLHERGHHLVDVHKAGLLLQSVSPLGGAWVFAVFTGVFLWASSLAAAWTDNWFVLHQLEPALAQHRRWQRWLGPTRARRAAHWLGENVAGLAGNISLGFMLGMAPEIARFFGLPLDVRHVTISTGQVSAAVASLGPGSLSAETVLGVLGIGAINVMVSFGLALLVAIRACEVRGPERTQFFRALMRRLFLKPWSFILPIGTRAEVPAVAP